MASSGSYPSMAEDPAPHDQHQRLLAGDPPHPPSLSTNGSRKLTLTPLIFLIFYEVSGGPIGTEGSVQAGGPLLAILGFLLFPFAWSIPEALITAEMATTYPENGGYVLWTSAAFGPFWGFLQGWWKWTSGVINNAIYPILCLDYLRSMVSVFSDGVGRALGMTGFTVILTYVNYRGVTIVGWSAVILGVISLLPFLIMVGFAVPRLDPRRWTEIDLGDVRWREYLNILFWNLNFWDNASTLAGEVQDPGRTFPLAILGAGFLVSCCYLLPLLAGTGAMAVSRSEWEDGFFAVLALRLGGRWLQSWMELGATLSCFGLFAAQMSSSSFQVLGMADMGILPSILGSRSSYGTPTFGILLSFCGALLLSFMSFTYIIQSANALYSCGMLIEFAAFVWLRVKDPKRYRPFRVPLGLAGSIAMCLLPCGLLLFVLALSTIQVIVFAFLTTALGVLLYVALGYSNRRNWLHFVAADSTKSYEAPVAWNSSEA